MADPATIGECAYKAHNAEFVRAGLSTVRNEMGQELVLKEWYELLPVQQMAWERMARAVADFARDARDEAEEMAGIGQAELAHLHLARMGLGDVSP